MFLKRSFMIAFSVLIALFIVACGNATTSGGGSYGGGSSTPPARYSKHWRHFYFSDSNGDCHHQRSVADGAYQCKMNTRELKGKEIAARLKIVRKDNKWIVPSQTGNGKYTVDIDGKEPHCTCPDYELRGLKCSISMQSSTPSRAKPTTRTIPLPSLPRSRKR